MGNRVIGLSFPGETSKVREILLSSCLIIVTTIVYALYMSGVLFGLYIIL